MRPFKGIYTIKCFIMILETINLKHKKKRSWGIRTPVCKLSGQRVKGRP